MKRAREPAVQEAPEQLDTSPAVPAVPAVPAAEESKAETELVADARAAAAGSAEAELAGLLRAGRRVVFLTGAGLSVASGIPTFRAKDGVWDTNLMRWGTRAAFQQWGPGLTAEQSAIEWWNQFWLPTHGLTNPDGVTSVYRREPGHWHQARPEPNSGHVALARIGRECPATSVITQNIDGLHLEAMGAELASRALAEVHGRTGLFKCIVPGCRFAKAKSLTLAEVGMSPGEWASPSNLARCPRHRRQTCCLPQSLFFDELYASHSFYRNPLVEDWLAELQVLVLVGTSCAVGITQSALSAALANDARVFSYNISGFWAATAEMVARGELAEALADDWRTAGLEVNEVLGPSEETLPRLAKLLTDATEPDPDSQTKN